MSIYALKPGFQALLRPLVARLHSIKLTANQVTIAAALGSLTVAAAVFLYATEWPWLFLALPIWMLLRMALNAIDGMLAREFDQQSRLGAYLNELCDVISDVALYLSLLVVPGLPAWPLLLFAGLATMTEYTGVLGPLVGAARRYDGPMGKSDRALLLGLLGVLMAFDGIGATTVEWALHVANALCVVTVLRRLHGGIAQGRLHE